MGAQELKLDPALCNNLVDRWTSISQGNDHDNLMAFLTKQGLAKDGKVAAPYKTIYELFAVKAISPEKAIVAWINSPGHKLVLENPEFNVGCSYVEGGTGVVIMAKK